MTGLNHLVRLQGVTGWCTAQCIKMLLFCTKTIMKVSRNFELACLKKKEKKNVLAVQFGTFTMFFMPLGVLFIMETLEDKW